MIEITTYGIVSFLEVANHVVIEPVTVFVLCASHDYNLN